MKGRTYIVQGKNDLAENMYDEVYKHNNARAYIDMANIYIMNNRFEDAEAVLKKKIKEVPDKSVLYHKLIDIYKKTGNEKLAKKYEQESEELDRKNFNAATLSNYRRLAEIANKKNIKLVAVQYPMRPVSQLKSMLSGFDNVVFVDNQKVFMDALEKRPYKDYFVDTFAGDFGHGTYLGNKILAENVAKTILEIALKQ